MTIIFLSANTKVSFLITE